MLSANAPAAIAGEAARSLMLPAFLGMVMTRGRTFVSMVKG
jgi:hypothetical protein